MRNYKIIFLIICFWGNLLYSQSSGLSTFENFISTKNYVSKGSDTLTKQPLWTVQYFDGIGRIKQTVNVKSTPSGKDLITHTEYDQYGRQAKEYLPIPQQTTQNGGINYNPLNNATNPAVYGTEKIYAEKIFENSPVERVQRQIQLGNDWSNKSTQFNYDRNTVGEVKKYVTTTTWVNGATSSQLTVSGTYGNNQLYKNTRLDEDNYQVINFVDGEGRTILNRKVISASENADTYYVYNEYDQLSFVIPPLASASGNTDGTTLNALCYQYRYDNKSRLVEKRPPGKDDWEFLVYDKQNRIVLTQDPMMGSLNNNFSKKGWIFTKYDQFGRIVYTGFFANSATRATMQAAINNMAANPGNNESRSTTSFNLNGIDIFYTKNAFPTGSMTLLSINYYDTYPLGAPILPGQILGQDVMQDTPNSSLNTKSLPLATFIKNIDDDNWTKNFNRYDTKGRLIGTYSVNHLGGISRSESLLDFSGLAKETHTYHKRTANDTETHIKEIFEYDNQNRLTAQKHQVNNKPEEPIVINTYNEIGQVINKKIGKDDDGNPLQSINYTYNIHGWLTSINDPSNMGPDNIFAMKIKYQNPEDANYGIARYNGNISEIDWKTALGDGISRRYAYQYDYLNRLSKGIYLTPGLTSNSNNHYYDETVTYDLNGNIKTLNRYKNPPVGQTTPMQIDELVYNYDLGGNSNRLIKVTDQKMNPSGYPLGGNLIGYDANGNMSDHMDKQVKTIKYNYLNLATSVNAIISGFTPGMNEGTLHSYKYRADGSKYYKRVDNVNPYSTDYSETDYIDGFQYERTYSKMNTAQNASDSGYTLKSVPTAEGFYNFEREEYIYNLKDHLGNVRYNITRADGGGRILMEETNYYPFGLKHEGYNNGSYLSQYGIKNTYKYNGKELQETGMYDYGARNYMPDLGRWGVIDPLSEKYQSFSPFNYTLNNPLNLIDPDGRSVYPPRKGLNYYVDGDGIFRWNQGMDKYEHYANTPENPSVSNGFLGYYSMPETESSAAANDTPASEGVVAKGNTPTVNSSPAVSQPQKPRNLIPRSETLDAIVNHPGTSPTMAGFGQATAKTSAKLIQSVDRAGKIGRELWWGPKFLGTFRTSTTWASRLATTVNFTGNAVGVAGLGFTSYQYLSGQITGTEAFFDGGVGVLSFWCPACGLIYFGGKTLYEQTTGRPAFTKPPGISNEITPLFGQPFIFKY